jgi:hypothetical protein
MISIICTDGQLGLTEIQKECVKGKWIPLLVLKQNNNLILPIFNLVEIARKFIKRNLPKEWNHGCVFLCEDDIVAIKKRDWKIEIFDFPRKVNENPEIELGFEIHEFEEEPDFKCTK